MIERIHVSERILYARDLRNHCRSRHLKLMFHLALGLVLNPLWTRGIEQCPLQLSRASTWA